MYCPLFTNPICYPDQIKDVVKTGSGQDHLQSKSVGMYVRYIAGGGPLSLLTPKRKAGICYSLLRDNSKCKWMMVYRQRTALQILVI